MSKPNNCDACGRRVTEDGDVFEVRMGRRTLFVADCCAEDTEGAVMALKRAAAEEREQDVHFRDYDAEDRLAYQSELIEDAIAERRYELNA